MRSFLMMFFAISVCSSLIFPSQANAYAYTTYYGVFQHPYQTFAYLSRISDGVYERQNNPYISAYSQAIFSERYGYPPVEGEDWTFELYDTETDQLLGYVSYYYSNECLYAEVDGYTQILGCLADPSGDYSFNFIATFATQCLETKNYYIAASHASVSAPKQNFRPTRFQPTEGEIISGSLASIPPKLPEIDAQKTTISVLVKDNLDCNVPLEDIPISVKNTLVPESGSHKHFNDDEETGTGEYVASIPPWSTINDDKTHIASVTDQEGLFTANYQAGIYGIQENVTVKVINPDTNEELESSGTLDIRIPGLSSLNAQSGPYILLGSFKTSCDKQHNDSSTQRRSHYLKERVVLGVEAVANEYLSRTDAMLSFNDGSLEYGGFFDKGSNLRSERCHISHRKGIDIDLNKIDTGNNNIRDKKEIVIGENGAPEPLLSLVNNIFRSQGARRIVEETSLHYRFDR